MRGDTEYNKCVRGHKKITPLRINSHDVIFVFYSACSLAKVSL